MTIDDPADILLVEDNANDCELALRVFKKCGYANSVRVIKDGAAAIEFFFGDGSDKNRKERMPKVIFLDLKLPKIGGLEVLERIKSSDLTKSIPVVVLSSSKEVHDVHRSYALGANSYIVKPLDYETYTASMTSTCEYWMSLNHPPA